MKKSEGISPNTRSKAKKHKNEQNKEHVRNNPTEKVIDMTNEDIPATPTLGPAKKRRIFSPPRNMEIDNDNSNVISVTPEGKKATDISDKELKIYLTESESA
eukprot:9938870-Ditylum_brightwellii.AAC.1